MSFSASSKSSSITTCGRSKDDDTSAPPRLNIDVDTLIPLRHLDIEEDLSEIMTEREIKALTAKPKMKTSQRRTKKLELTDSKSSRKEKNVKKF